MFPSLTVTLLAQVTGVALALWLAYVVAKALLAQSIPRVVVAAPADVAEALLEHAGTRRQRTCGIVWDRREGERGLEGEKGSCRTPPLPPPILLHTHTHIPTQLASRAHPHARTHATTTQPTPRAAALHHTTPHSPLDTPLCIVPSLHFLNTRHTPHTTHHTTHHTKCSRQGRT